MLAREIQPLKIAIDKHWHERCQCMKGSCILQSM